MNKTDSYDCGECDKKYKSLKTLERHMIKMHSIEEVEASVVEDMEPDNKPKDDQNHNCETCIECKDDIKYLKTVINLAILRHVEHIKFMKEVSENFSINFKNSKITMDNFEYFNNKINKIMNDVDFLMKVYNKKSKSNK
jgi:hypothetical protein